MDKEIIRIAEALERIATSLEKMRGEPKVIPLVVEPEQTEAKVEVVPVKETTKPKKSKKKVEPEIIGESSTVAIDISVEDMIGDEELHIKNLLDEIEEEEDLPFEPDPKPVAKEEPKKTKIKIEKKEEEEDYDF